MRIERVSYSRLQSFGQYQNETIGAEMSLGDDEIPAEALRCLEQWVIGQLAVSMRGAGSKSTMENLDDQIERKKRELEAMSGRWERARAFLERHGIRTEEDLPF